MSDYKYQSGILDFDGGWRVEVVVDEDNHLSIWLSNSDGTHVRECCADIADDYEDWAERFTTDGIEEKYHRSQEVFIGRHRRPALRGGSLPKEDE